MPDHPINAPVCRIDFYAANAIFNPLAAYRDMLNTGPVVWQEQNQLYAICSHAAVTAALRNYKHFSSAKGVSIDDACNRMSGFRTWRSRLSRNAFGTT